MQAKAGSRAGWAWVAAAAVIAGGSALLARLGLAAPVAGAVGAVVAVVAGAWMSYGVAVASDPTGRRRAVPGSIWRAWRGGLPRVRDVADPVALGVHPAVQAAESADARVPPFVVREFCAELRLALLRDHFVLLVGESTAGKTRAAYELMQAELRGCRVVIPSQRDTAVAAAELAADTARSVLWLDDLERFLGSGGLTGDAVRRVLGAPHRTRFIIATMRSEEYAKLSGRIGAGADGVGGDIVRQSQDVLRQARRIEVPRPWSARDLAVASEAEDGRLADAVQHASEFGVAEYLAAAPQLLAGWRDAWSPGAHPRAAAMVLAAVDARRAGLHRPLPEHVLVRLHEPYLIRRGGERLRPEPAESALAWAAKPLHATSSLLLPSDGGYLAFDYLIDATDKDRVPPAALDVLINFATPGEAIDIGRLAWSWSLPDQAEAAFARAEDSGLFDATSLRSYLIREHSGTSTALRYVRDAATRIAAATGRDDPQFLRAQALVAWHVGHAGEPAAALRALGELAGKFERAVGSDHPLTLELQLKIASMTGEAGNYLEAAQLYGVLTCDSARVLGEDHNMTLVSRDQRALWLREAGEHHLSVELLTDLVSDMKRLGSPLPDLLHTREQLAWSLGSADQHDLALQHWRQLVNEIQDAHGFLHSSALFARHEYAWCTGEAGDPALATDLLMQLLVDIATLQSPGAHIAHHARRSLAWWIGETGNTSKAIEQLRQLKTECKIRLGDTDPQVKALQYVLTYWETLSAEDKDAPELIQHNVAEMTAHLGPDHHITRAARRRLAILLGNL